MAEFPVTVIARAAEVWISQLGNDTANGALHPRGIPVGSGPLKGAWELRSAGWAVYPAEQETQSAQDEAQAPETPPPTTLTPHGTWWDRQKADRLDAVMEGRFTRLFPYLPSARFAQHDLERLAHEMTAPKDTDADTEPDPEENPGIPAAYTYLGQFVDHDLTFDPISHLRETLTGAQLRALVDFRTPRFDLDNLYGRGPDDQPYMYRKDGIRMLLGESMSGKPYDPGAVQLPRGPSGRALIGDPRNDENRIVAQLHAIFLRFHNRVVQKMGGTRHVSFREARDQVRWHYQWILVNDFLPTILEEQTYQSVFPDPYGPVPGIPRLRENDLELMPVEFSVGAYRFGHSMVRPRYRLNPTIERPIFSNYPYDDTADLGGFRPIPAGWAIDWQFFIDLGRDAGRKDRSCLTRSIPLWCTRSATCPLDRQESVVPGAAQPRARHGLPVAFGAAGGQGTGYVADPRRGAHDRPGDRRRYTKAHDRGRTRLRRQRSAVGLHPVRGAGDVVEERLRSGLGSDPHQARTGGRPAGRRGLRLPAPRRPHVLPLHRT